MIIKNYLFIFKLVKHFNVYTCKKQFQYWQKILNCIIYIIIIIIIENYKTNKIDI